MTRREKAPLVCLQHVKHPEASQAEICKTDGHTRPRKKDGEHNPSYHMGAPPPASSVPLALPCSLIVHRLPSPTVAHLPPWLRQVPLSMPAFAFLRFY
jgi:hypothetical protein